MKRMLLLTVLSVVTLLTSCKKSSQETEAGSRLMGKWTLKNDVTTYFNGIQVVTNTSNFEPNEYMQFEPGGKFLIRVDEEITQSSWKLLDNDKTLYITPVGDLDVPDDGYEIKTLNDHNLVLYWKEAGTSAYSVTINLER
jgi:hypothetical protein